MYRPRHITSACTSQPAQILAPVCGTRGVRVRLAGRSAGRAAAAGDAQGVMCLSEYVVLTLRQPLDPIHATGVTWYAP